MSYIKDFDLEVYNAIVEEENRQEEGIELIASENFVSKAVMEAAGSVFTNKYAEGYPGKRYYGGCVNADVVESLAIERLKKIFGAKYANVQPHSGSQANMGVYVGLLEAGDKILGMSLSAGGHLTHGYKINFSGKNYIGLEYGLNPETELIDYEAVREIALREKPKMIVAGASAYSRIIDFKKFREIADEIGAYLMVDMAHIAGLVAAGLHPNPIEYADVVTSTTHKTLRGPRGGIILTNDEEIAKSYQSFMSIPEIEDRVILVDSISKHYSATGARIGVIASKNKDFMAQALKFCQARLSVSTIEQYASTNLINTLDTYIDNTKLEYKVRRDMIYNNITKIPGVVTYKPSSSLYLIAELPVDDIEKFAIWLLTEFRYENQTLSFAPGPGFYTTPGKGIKEARFSFCTHNLIEIENGMKVLKKALEEYNKINK